MDATIPEIIATSAAGEHLDRLTEDHLRRLLAVSHVFNSTINLDELLPRVLDLVLEVVGAEAGSLWLLDGEVTRCEYSRGPVEDRLTGVELPAGAGIVGDVIRRREPSLVTDTTADERFLEAVDAATGFETRSVITVPLVARQETVGAIQVVNSTDGKPFDQEDIDFLLALADDAAAGIRNAALFEAEKRARDLKSLLDISHEITATFDVDRVMVSVVNLAGRAIAFRRCILALMEDERVRVRAVSGEAAVARKSAAIREIERFVNWALERGGRLRIPDLADGESEEAVAVSQKFPRYVEEAGARGLLLLPVEDVDGRLGVLLFEFDQPDQPAEWGLEAAQLLANETALALRNAQLYREVPFISWLEPLAEKRRQLAALPRATWLRYGAITLALLAVLTLVRLPLRVAADTSTVRAAVQVPARALSPGLVDAVLVREGERVERGERLARLRDESLLREIRETEARRELAERELLAAEGRGDALAGSVARVRLAEAVDALGILRRQLEESWVVAPAAGVVLTSRLEERVGEWLTAGSPLLWVGSPEWAELELRVPQEDIGEVRVGQPVRARVPAHPAITFEGRVAAVAPAPEVAAGPTAGAVYTVRAILDNREGLLWPGMEARARIHTDARPLGALIFRRPWRWLRLKFWW